MPHWLQPLATVVGPVTAAIIVLFSVRATLKHNWDRLGKEQREKRAKDREQALQQQYGDFAAAAYSYGPKLQEVRDVKETHRRLVEQRAAVADLEPLIQAANAGVAELGRLRAAMLSAIARLRLLLDAPDCIEALKQFFDQCDNNQQFTAEGKTRFETELSEFLVKVSKRLGDDYAIAVMKDVADPVVVKG